MRQRMVPVINTGRGPMTVAPRIRSTRTAERAHHPVGRWRLSPHRKYFSKGLEIFPARLSPLDFSNITELSRLLGPST